MVLSVLVTLLATCLLILQFIKKKGDFWHIVRFVSIVVCVGIALWSIEEGLPVSFHLSTHFLFGYLCIGTLLAAGITGLLLKLNMVASFIHRFSVIALTIFWVLTFAAPWLF